MRGRTAATAKEVRVDSIRIVACSTFAMWACVVTPAPLAPTQTCAPPGVDAPDPGGDAAAPPASPPPTLRVPAVFSLGVSTHHFDLTRRTVTGIDATGQPASASAAPMGAFRGETLDSDVGMYLGALYVGMEVQFGTGSIDHPLLASAAARGGAPTGAPFGVSGGGVLASAGLVGGLALPQLGSVTPQVEVYAGGAMMFLTPDVASRYPCDPDAGCQVPGVATWVVEPRVRLRGWLRPHVSLDAWGGYGIGPSTGDWSLGVAATVHVRGFDGR
jgi:hypothetical protein